MTDQNLTDLLERAGERIPSGSPPLRRMIEDAGRSRRQRRARWTGALAVVSIGTVVGLVVGGPSLFPATDSRPSPTPAPLDVTSDVPVEPIAEGTRLVGINHAAIAVPEDWATNAIHCGEAKRATVVIDVTVVELCAWLDQETHDTVWVEPGLNRAMFDPREDIEIDGQPARADEITCSNAGNGTTRCAGTVFVPSSKVSFRAIAATEQRVAEILSWIHILDDVVAVPGFGQANMDHQEDDAAEHYRAELERAGLAVEVITESRPGMPAGYVLDVSPAPGTMLEPGQTVTMTEVAEPHGPADLVRVDLNSVGAGDSMDYRGRTDAQLRAGTRIELEVGSTIWVHGSGPEISTLAGELSGTALELDGWQEGPNYGHSWVAVERGTTTITVTITADGKRVVIGTVEVVVR